MMTTTLTSRSTEHRKNKFNIISWTALLVGILDISSAIIKYYIDKDSGPAPLFKFIASGAFGKDAITGGTLMIIWGVVFHFMISFIFTVVLFLIYPMAIKWLKNKFITGIVYGLTTWIIMNLVVLPLSSIPARPFDLIQVIIAAVILICMIGIPVALIAHWYYKQENTA